VKSFPKLIISLALPFIAGGIGSYFTISSIDSWYHTLEKPSFSPPDFLFGPVWTALYILMGISFYLIWTSKGSKNKERAIKLFLIQLFLNTSWSIVFFGFQNPLLGLVNIIALWVMIFLTIRAFFLISRSASYLLLPYILWVSFASILNFAIVVLN